LQGHYERPPYQNDTLRSAYHVRELEVYRLMQLRRPLDVFLSHDWPQGIERHGNTAQLCRAKPFLRREARIPLCFGAQQPPALPLWPFLLTVCEAGHAASARLWLYALVHSV
jgi:hypothetical protein